MLKSLDMLPSESFDYKLRERENIAFDGSYLWGGLISNVLLHLFNFGFSDVISYGPSYLKIIQLLIWDSLAVYVIPCIIFSFKGLSQRFRCAVTFFQIISFIMLEIIILWMLTLIVITLCCTHVGNKPAIDDTQLVIISSIIILIEGIIIHLLFFLRMKRRIIDGHFRKGGAGFWGNSKYMIKIIAFVTIVSPLFLIILRTLYFIGKISDTSIVWIDAYNPIAIILAPIVANVVFVLMAYRISLSIVGMYCLKRFGDKKLFQ